MSQYSAGAVWSTLIDFRKGAGEQKKYFVLLTDCEAAGEEFLFGMTTSQGDKHYDTAARAASPCGCPDHNFFRIEAGQEACFPMTTWVQFTNGGHIGPQDLADLVKRGKAEFVQMLSPDRTRTLLNCAKKSQDILKRDLERIDRALKARNPVKKSPAPAPAKAAPPAQFVDPAFRSAHARMDRYCDKCRTKLSDLIGINAPQLATILQGKEKAPDGFLANVETGFDLIGSGCEGCAK